ncbi:MAG: hypothetical protein JJ863_02555 [Deltaproteobacteria bacterium]|nr:hypothetical protein [Deltaproteobacteria bacterium]
MGESLPIATPLADPRLKAGPSDRYFDYCLEAYAPRRPLTERSRRSEAFLWASLEHAGIRERMEPLLEAIRASVGRDLTVWGVKLDRGQLWWELYFYDPRDELPASKVEALRQTLAPWVALTPVLPAHQKYMMVSFDLDGPTLDRGTVDQVDLYLTGTPEHAGRAYAAVGDPATFELRNTYRFLDPKREIDVLLPLLQASVFADLNDEKRLAQALMPRFFPCKRICAAKKRDRDGIYFSGIAIDQLADFLERFEYPAPLRALATEHEAAFEHLSFDIGIDYRQEGEALVYPKSSFYGTL